jgi:hypothetical protein
MNMRKILLAVLLSTALPTLFVACTAENTSRPQQGVPAAITAAFTAGHPYATIDKFTQHDMSDGSTQYEIKYTRPDGTHGNAVYAPSGETISDE